MRNWKRNLVLAVAVLAVVGVTTGQLRQAIKIIGVGAAVKQFGPDINKGFNKLTNHTNTNDKFTKVVPILTVGVVGAKGAIGAAQVMGAKANVEKVQAVASPEADLFGREFRLRALIPISSMNVTNPKEISAVPGVGVSGIVDLKL
ncbi:MAG: hypothetical protein KF884_10425 [Fimbriimonadaceae bacterium]|nr:hypothetical protein [Fimbriimonadaceae bacterium]QYK57961.1 MAG: hypothetical protein KF884_10425 [Fimbriimonadaceae bacterium]